MLYSEYKIQSYVERIRNPEIREIYTRLRIDMNCLSTSKTQNQQSELCPFCESGPEDVEHFLFTCNRYHDIRLEFCNNLLEKENIDFNVFTMDRKLSYVLNVESSAKTTSTCCKFLKKMYLKRLEDKNTSITRL